MGGCEHSGGSWRTPCHSVVSPLGRRSTGSAGTQGTRCWHGSAPQGGQGWAFPTISPSPHLGIHRKVGHQAQLVQDRLHKAVHSPLNVPVHGVGLGVRVQQAEGDLIPCKDPQPVSHRSCDRAPKSSRACPLLPGPLQCGVTPPEQSQHSPGPEQHLQAKGPVSPEDIQGCHK